MTDHNDDIARIDTRKCPDSLVEDGTEFPWAQDLDGVWHRRPTDDAWGDPETEVQAHGQCGAAFGSVHVSTVKPAPDEALNERLCALCADPSIPPGETA